MRSPRLITGVVAVVALAAGVMGGFVLDNGGSRQVTATPVAQTAAGEVPAACIRAIDRADRSIAVASRVAGELADHTRVMDQLIAAMAGVDNGMTAHKAFTQGMVSINKGRYDRRVFADLRADYDAVKRSCQA